MNAQSPEPIATDTALAVGMTPAAKPDASQRWLALVAVVAALGVLGSVLLWQKLGHVQEQLARQAADSGAQASEARGTAKQAQELAIETAAKIAVFDAKLTEVALQRTQLEELMQSLSRSRDENLVVDVESGLRLAQQQAQLTGSVEPLLTALKSAEQRVTRAAQPRLAPIQRAIAKDIARIKNTALSDTPAMLLKLDELVSLADEIPVSNALPSAKTPPALERQAQESLPGWWGRLGTVIRDEVRGLVRVSKIDNPDAALLSPEQAFFVRENFKLKILNARLGLLARQTEAARADLSAASGSLTRFFDGSSRKTQAAQAALQALQSQMRTLEVPRVDDTLAALATAAAGR
ncbi:MAG: uroporphyrinogen-III C-methyltransferase [Rhodoferax sp.]|uniref:uroporphyrinogen-III C-methyltransferase n=1 Tax=Rhodoferax sp. TaxID=50421 RepID=UPI002ACD625C|nr:uroporphyrinogen-III C-methyltransferase [Rhodoferax sp.]MDZ7891594.1 uroporphyrinogen-III C-methyltransferase [Rhodoferax sp.]